MKRNKFEGSNPCPQVAGSTHLLKSLIKKWIRTVAKAMEPNLLNNSLHNNPPSFNMNLFIEMMAMNPKMIRLKTPNKNAI